MGLFDRLVQWRSNVRIRSLEQSLSSRPTPVLYLQLADAHKDAGNQTKSAQVLKLGAARFPTAPEIVRRQAEAEKFEREMEKRRLVEKIQNHPNPILYARLAELYKADDELTRTVDTCQRGIKAFPKYGGTYLVLGQIYAEKKQWLEASLQLEKSVSLDKYNYLALKLLAQMYMELTRPADAAQRLEDILFFAPGDEAILHLLNKARMAADALQPKPNSSLLNSNSARASASKTQAKGLPSHPVSGAMRNSSFTSRPSPKDHLFAKGLAELRAISGVMGAILVDQYGLVVASDLDKSLDEALVGALITSIYRSASTNSVKLGVGQFEEGLLEGDEGNIHIVQFDDMILTVFAKAAVKVGLLEKTIRDFALAAIKRK
jgi:predicted regulator of Ras-like GTPase activity (Roadblock/LC7/MglB family)